MNFEFFKKFKIFAKHTGIAQDRCCIWIIDPGRLLQRRYRQCHQDSSQGHPPPLQKTLLIAVTPGRKKVYFFIFMYNYLSTVYQTSLALSILECMCMLYNLYTQTYTHTQLRIHIHENLNRPMTWTQTLTQLTLHTIETGIC